MHSHSQTGKMVGAFVRRNSLAVPMSVVAVYIGNLRTLEALAPAACVIAQRRQRCWGD